MVAEFPDRSSAYQVIIDSPYGKTSGALFKIVISCTSTTVGSSIDIKFSETEVASKIISSGGIISGAIVSIILTNCCLVAILPDESAALQVTVVFPIPKN